MGLGDVPLGRDAVFKGEGYGLGSCPKRYLLLVTKSCPALYDPMDCSPSGSSVHGISQQEYWSGLPFPSPGDLLDSGIKPMSPALQVDSLPLNHQRNPFMIMNNSNSFKLVQVKRDQYRPKKPPGNSGNDAITGLGLLDKWWESRFELQVIQTLQEQKLKCLFIEKSLFT